MKKKILLKNQQKSGPFPEHDFITPPEYKNVRITI